MSDKNTRDLSLATVRQLEEDRHELTFKLFKFREESINTVSIESSQKVIEFITKINLIEEELLKRKQPVSSLNPMNFYNTFFTKNQLLEIVNDAVTGAVYCRSGEGYAIAAWGEINGFKEELEECEDQEEIDEVNDVRELKKIIEKVIPDTVIL